MRRLLLAAAATALLAAAAAAKTSKGIDSLCDILYPSDSHIAWHCFKPPLGKAPEQLWPDHWIDVLRFNRLDRVHYREFNSIKLPDNLDDIRDFIPMPLAYQPAEKDEKFILIDLAEQFLSAYEYGRLAFSTPITAGSMTSRTPPGIYRITAFDRDHKSSQYPLEVAPKEPYPMRHALMFFKDSRGVQYWIHGRDMPGYPGSHGCIGLYDEEMERTYFGEPAHPVLNDAKRLFDWVVAGRRDTGRYTLIKDGPRVEIRGKNPRVPPPPPDGSYRGGAY